MEATGRTAALHQNNVLDVSPTALIEIAARLQCSEVCVFVSSPHSPFPGQDIDDLGFPVVTKQSQNAFARQARDAHVSVTNIEFFPLGVDPDFATFERQLAIGAALGARRAVAHVHDPERRRAIATLVRFADLAGSFGLDVGLEFIGPLSPPCATFEAALGHVRDAARPNLGVAVDALHLIRNGGSPAALAAASPSEICYAQLCDGPAEPSHASYLAECIDRVVPGEGDFPLVDFLRALPSSTPIDIEVPMQSRIDSGVSAFDRAARAVFGSRRVIVQALASQVDGPRG